MICSRLRQASFLVATELSALSYGASAALDEGVGFATPRSAEGQGQEQLARCQTFCILYLELK